MLSAYITDVTDPMGLLSPQRISETLRMPLAQLARLVHVHRNTMTRHPGSPSVQARLGEVARVIATAADLLGGDTGRAVLWFRHQPLSGFDGQTAEDLVAAGAVEAVLAHLETLRDGGYG